MSEWVVVAASQPGRYDGIGDYAGHLAAALGATLVVSGPSRLRRPGLSPRSNLPGQAGPADSADLTGPPYVPLVVNYAPQNFRAAEIAVLERRLTAARRSGRPAILTVHEYWPPSDGTLRRAFWRFVCRRRLARLIRSASDVVVTQENARRELEAAGMLERRRAHVIPVGSNIPRVSSVGAELRDPRKLVMFGQPAAMHAATLAAINQWLDAHAAYSLCWVKGGLPADQVSARLAEAGIGLAPYVNGASTRRTTLAAMLQHGLPIVATDGISTDDTLRASGALLLSPEGDPGAFVRNLEALLGDAADRQRRSAAAEQFFCARLDWPRIAAAYVDVVAGRGTRA